eukprot:3032577-Pleurochrysis_carterae.AAC.1
MKRDGICLNVLRARVKKVINGSWGRKQSASIAISLGYRDISSGDGGFDPRNVCKAQVGY